MNFQRERLGAIWPGNEDACTLHQDDWGAAGEGLCSWVPATRMGDEHGVSDF